MPIASMKHLVVLIFVLLVFVGSACSQIPVFDTYGEAEEIAGNCYRITPDENNEVGAIWSQDMLDMSQSWDMIAEVYLGTSNNNGGDGMAFVLRAPGSDAMQPNNPPGNNGQYMGFAQIEPSLIVEIDTDRNNSADDPDEPRDHLALMRDGNPDHDSPDCLVQPVAAIPPDVNIEDDEFHDLRVKWDADDQTITVWFDCLWRFSESVDAVDILGGTEAIYGFTASTYEEENEHRVCNVEFINQAEISLEDQLICGGETVTLSIPDSYENVEWSPSAGLNTIQGSTVEASPAQTTVYTVTYDALCGNSGTEMVEVVVEAAPGGVADVSFALCNSEPVEFAADALPPGYTAVFGPADDPLPVVIDAVGSYDWTVTTPNGCSFDYVLDVTNTVINEVDLGADFSLCLGQTVTLFGDVGNPGVPVTWNGSITGDSFTVSQPGTVTVTVGDQACSVSDEVEVTLAPVFSSDLQSNYTLCFQDVVTVDASDASWASGPVDYVWSNGDDTPSVTLDVAGNYEVTITAAGCTYNAQTQISDSPITTVNLGADPTLCEGDWAQFASGYTTAQTTWWFNGQPQAPGNVFTTNAPGLVEVEVVSGACSASDEVNVAVIDSFDASLPAGVSYCEGAGIQVVAASGADSYAWSNGDVGIYGWADVPGLLTLETTVDGCVFEHTVYVTELPIPTPDLGPDGEFCAGEPVVLQAGYANADWYQWNDEGGGESFEVTSSGTITVEVSVDGCVGTDEVVIGFIAIPEFDLGPNLQRCPDDPILLEAGPFIEATSVVWNQGSSAASQWADHTGWYTATASSGDCTYSDSVHVQFDTSIEPMLSADQHKCLESDLILDASEGIGNHLFPVSYLWETGDYQPVIQLDHTGEFGLTIYNLCESVGMIVSVDAIDCDCNVFVPSAFTPDNDGRNDRFIPSVGCTPTEYEFFIMNRWGQVVFRTENVEEGWLGEFQGGEGYFGNLDLYHWKIHLVWQVDGSVIPRHEYRSGLVTMVR